MKRISFVAVGLLLCRISFSQVDTVVAASNPKLLPVLWQQHAAEYRALCYQAFNIATERLDKIKNKHKRISYAIIADIDETVLNNSSYEAELIMQDSAFSSDSWKRWTNRSQASAVPGAVEVLQFAKQKGISVFYISNRDTTEIESTLINLRKLNFPDADAAHFLFTRNTLSKEERRQTVLKQYNVLLLLGDNLNDFASVFEKKSSRDRLTETEKLKNEWGRRFIVLPNSSYGEWENALYDYEKNLNRHQKADKLKEKLILVKP